MSLKFGDHALLGTNCITLAFEFSLMEPNQVMESTILRHKLLNLNLKEVPHSFPFLLENGVSRAYTKALLAPKLILLSLEQLGHPLLEDVLCFLDSSDLLLCDLP
jgi:hypothetical protein